MDLGVPILKHFRVNRIYCSLGKDETIRSHKDHFM